MARLKEGSKIDEFEKIHYITSGGFGSVYRAFQSSTGLPIAIKQFDSQEDIVYWDEDLKYFKREAAILEAISSSPYFPNFIKFWQEDPNDKFSAFLAMEWIEGNTLHEEKLKNIKTNNLPDPKDWVDFMIDCLEGLKWLHAPNPSKLAEWADPIIHRDIKPKNLKITPVGEAKILDLGAGRFLKRQAGITQKETTHIGTVVYEAPESTQTGKVYPVSDIYSLGMTFYVFFTNADDQKTEGKSALEYLLAKDKLDPTSDFYDPNCPARFPMSYWNKKVDQSFQDRLYKMCYIKMSERCQSTQEAIDALNNWKAGKPAVIPTPAPAPTSPPRKIVAPTTIPKPVTPVAPTIKPIRVAPAAAMHKICSNCGGLVTEKFCIFCGVSWQGKTADKVCKKCGHWVPQNRCVSCGELWR